MALPPAPVDSARSGFARTPRSILLTLSALVTLAALATWATFAVIDYRTTIETTLQDQIVVADLLREHAHRTMEASDLVLRQLERTLERRGVNGLGPTQAGIHDRLNELAALLPQVGSLWVIGPEGRVEAASVRGAAGDGAYADREYFRVHAQDPGVGTHIGELLVGRETGRGFFSISRRLDGPKGSFAGIVVAAIHEDYFQDFFNDIGLPTGSSIAIFRRDGALMVRAPRPHRPARVFLPQIAEGLSEQTPQVARIATSPLDGRKRVSARQLVQDYPLVTLATRTLDATLAPWWTRLAWSTLTVALLLVAIAVLTAVGLRGLRGERALRAALSEANASLEERVGARTADLERAVRDKNVLLAEVYHRVKNNLQMVETLLALQSRDLSDPRIRDALMVARRRIMTLGQVHQQLLSAGDLATIRLDDFLGTLCRTLADGASAAARGITVTTDVEPVAVTIDTALPVGLLVNELLSNALIHAYPAGATGTVSVSLHHDRPDRLCLIVADDGVGHPGLEAASRAAPDRRGGTRIVQALVSQLEGEMSVHTNSGTRITVSVPLREPRHDG